MKNSPNKILVVDDDVDILDALTLTLEYAGYQVKTSEKAEYAESQIDTENNLPNLIILDILLSGKDGRTICQKLKSSPNTSHIPVIMISAHPDAGKSTKEVGADDFLAKPFEMDELLEKVSKYLGKAE